MSNPWQRNNRPGKGKNIIRQGWICLDCGNDKQFQGSFIDFCYINQDSEMPAYGDFYSDHALEYEAFYDVQCEKCDSQRVAYRFEYSDGGSYIDDILGRRRKEQQLHRFSFPEQDALLEVMDYMDVELAHLRKGGYSNIESLDEAVVILKKMLPEKAEDSS